MYTLATSHFTPRYILPNATAFVVPENADADNDDDDDDTDNDDGDAVTVDDDPIAGSDTSSFPTPDSLNPYTRTATSPTPSDTSPPTTNDIRGARSGNGAFAGADAVMTVFSGAQYLSVFQS